MPHADYAILEAPSILGLFPRGVETLPEALLGAGLAQRLSARHAGRVATAEYNPERDRATGVLNPDGIAAFSRRLADRIGALRRAGAIPVVLGGDCSILLGCLLALRRECRAGLLFLDGHADFYQPAAEPNGEAASMELAFATGRGPDVLANLEGLGPLVRDDDVVVLARRDAEIADAQGSQRIEATSIAMIDLEAVRAKSAALAADEALLRLGGPERAGFWLHLDADVLDDAIMPAVDYRMPGGLNWDELAAILRRAAASGRMLGIDVTIFNPKLDGDGAIARAFVDALASGLADDEKNQPSARRPS